MQNELKAGIKGRTDITVDSRVSATAAASGELEVYATPMMIALMEQTADQSVREYLPEGSATVGTRVDIRHISATPMGMQVHAVSELVEVDGRRLVFHVEAHDEAGIIGEGTHERFIVDKTKFMDKTNGKRK